MYDYIRYESPVGMLTVAAEGEEITALVIAGQKYENQHLAGDGVERETSVLSKARIWLEQYFNGENPALSDLPLAPKGTEFQKKVWRKLLEIPYGETVSYGDLAKSLGSSSRAVGSAVGRNPISILIPCHRVLAADGSLNGYAGGLENKNKLLKLEGSI